MCGLGCFVSCFVKVGVAVAVTWLWCHFSQSWYFRDFPLLLQLSWGSSPPFIFVLCLHKALSALCTPSYCSFPLVFSQKSLRLVSCKKGLPALPVILLHGHTISTRSVTGSVRPDFLNDQPLNPPPFLYPGPLLWLSCKAGSGKWTTDLKWNHSIT